MDEKPTSWWRNRLFEWTQRLDPWLGFLTFLALGTLIKHWGFFCWLICCFMAVLNQVLKYFMLVYWDRFSWWFLAKGLIKGLLIWLDLLWGWFWSSDWYWLWVFLVLFRIIGFTGCFFGRAGRNRVWFWLGGLPYCNIWGRICGWERNWWGWFWECCNRGGYFWVN